MSDDTFSTPSNSRPNQEDYGWGVGTKPFYVEVTNLLNGKRVRVRVNDTGPFAMHSNGEPIYPLRPHPRRIIDLSKAAMDRLGGSGIIDVRVEKLGSAPTKIDPPPRQNPNLAEQPTGRVSGFGRVGDTEYFYANGKYWQRKGGKTEEITSRTYAAIRSNHKQAFGIASTVDPNKMKLPGGGYRPKSDYDVSALMPQQNLRSVGPLKSQTDYEIASNYIIIKQKEVIRESTSGGGYLGGFSSSSIDSNNIAESLV